MIGGKAFSGIPSPLDCSEIDVLESPSKRLPGFSLLRVSCKQTQVARVFQQKTSVGPELLQKIWENNWTFFCYTSYSWSLGQKVCACSSRKYLGGHHLLLFLQSPHTCHSNGSPAESTEVSLQEKFCISHRYPLLHNSLVSSHFLLSFLGLLGLILLGCAASPRGKQRQGGPQRLRTDEQFRLAWHRRSKQCQR